MDVLERIALTGLVPVVVVENADDAVAAANAMLAADLDVMEITLRTVASLAAIRAVSEQVPNMLVGAGTVLTLENCQKAVAAGARFIVSPGFDPLIVNWCVVNQIPITPGCVTPTEITAALNIGLKTVKFFPANIYGGVKACSNLYAPFKSAGLSFIPTGGINNNNLAEYADKPFILAIGGSWLCSPEDISNHNYTAITQTARVAIATLLGFEVAHVGLNLPDAEAAADFGQFLQLAFDFSIKEGASSNFEADSIECLKANYRGSKGHIAIRTNNIARAMHYLSRRGFVIDMNTAKYKGDKLIGVYLIDEIRDFAMHLMQK